MNDSSINLEEALFNFVRIRNWPAGSGNLFHKVEQTTVKNFELKDTSGAGMASDEDQLGR